MRSIWWQSAGLLVGAASLAGLVVVGPPTEGPLGFPPGVAILAVAATAAALLRGRIGAGVGLLAVAIVVALSARPLGADLVGDRGLVVAVVRVVEILGLSVAVYAGVRRLVTPRQVDAERRRHDWSRLVQLVGLLALCAIGAELLSAYGDSTGDPGGIAFALVFFAALYGAPALLARELVRRLGWGWPSLLLLFAALGTAQACLIDQSMFSVDYQGYEGWEATREATLVPALGISALNAYNFVVGHVIFSFAAPVALAEAWVPARASKPWLGRVGTVLAALAYAGSGAMIVSDPESRSGTPVQLGVSAGLVAAFVAAAFVAGRRVRGSQETTEPGPRRSVWIVLMSGIVAALIPDLVGEGWVGLVVGVTVTGAFGVGIIVAARRWGWSVRHSAAAGFAFLLVRGVLAFTYFPLLGDVAPFPKYAHNTIMLLVVVLAGYFALRPRDRLPSRDLTQGADSGRGWP